MQSRKLTTAGTYFLAIFFFAPICLLMVASGCGSQKPAEQPAAPQAAGARRYALTGRVVSLDKPKLQVTVAGADIPGFMMAMTMGYSVKNATLLDPLSPEDQIKADVVVNGDDTYLENIVVTKKADTAKSATPGDAHSSMPQPDKK